MNEFKLSIQSSLADTAKIYNTGECLKEALKYGLYSETNTIKLLLELLPDFTYRITAFHIGIAEPLVEYQLTKEQYLPMSSEEIRSSFLMWQMDLYAKMYNELRNQICIHCLQAPSVNGVRISHVDFDYFDGEVRAIITLRNVCNSAAGTVVVGFTQWKNALAKGETTGYDYFISKVSEFLAKKSRRAGV